VIDKDSVSSERITIQAPAELVWSVITDFEHYHLWNAFCPQVSGELELGAPLSMRVDLGNGLQDQVECITHIEAPTKIVWSMENKPGDPIHADRSQIIEVIDDRRCTYITIDEFSGEMVPQMMEAMAEVVERGFAKCAEGLKARAEALYLESRA
jgi:uncharacterized protein YndB with AHSA1/START domain